MARIIYRRPRCRTDRHIDLLGWAAKFGVWIDPSKAVGPGSKGFAWLGSIGSLVATYVFTLVVTSIGAYFMGTKVKKFVAGYTVIYWIAHGGDGHRQLCLSGSDAE